MSRELESPISALRRRAEVFLEQSANNPDLATEDEVKALVHDLQVHQIELELQNEELRETQKNLQSARDSYARLFHHAPVGYLIVDVNGMIVQINATFCQMLQTEITKLLGKPLTDFLESRDREIFLGRFKAFFKQPEGKKLELQMLLGSRSFPARIWGRVEEKIPLFDHHQKTSPGLLLIVSDITEEKEAEAKLLAAKEIAEAGNRAKSEFLLNMSHELRTPLNGLLGMLHLLESPTMSEEQRNLLDMAVRSGKRLADVLLDILDMTSLDSGQLTLNNKLFFPTALIQSVQDIFDPVCREKELRLRTEVDSAMSMVVGDEVRIRQVLFNLVGNAVKFTSSGEVHLRLVIELPDPEAPPTLLITVRDTGIGMSGEQLEHAFDSFYQGDLSFTKRYPGAGLGLTIVRRLVDLMGGRLSVKSELEQGTEVQCSIPLARGGD